MERLDRRSLSAQLLLHAAAGDVLARVSATLADAGIPSVPVKGVITAHQLYASPAERPITDVDLRVAPEDVARALDVGRTAGWTVIRYAPAYWNVVFEISGLMVDIEGTVGPPGVCALSVHEMIARARAVDGRRVPEIHDHALLLVVNAFKDKLVSAAPWSVEDLVRVVRQPEFEPTVFVARVREARSVALVWFVADWLARARDDDAWRAIRDMISVRPPRPVFQRALGASIERAPNALPARVLARVASDDPRMWVGALARALRWRVRAALTRFGPGGRATSRG